MEEIAIGGGVEGFSRLISINPIESFKMYLLNRPKVPRISTFSYLPLKNEVFRILEIIPPPPPPPPNLFSIRFSTKIVRILEIIFLLVLFLFIFRCRGCFDWIVIVIYKRMREKVASPRAPGHKYVARGTS